MDLLTVLAVVVLIVCGVSFRECSRPRELLWVVVACGVVLMATALATGLWLWGVAHGTTAIAIAALLLFRRPREEPRG